jgi:hypothetical protein
LVQAWDEARGTRYLRPQAFQTPAVPPPPEGKPVIV